MYFIVFMFRVKLISIIKNNIYLAIYKMYLNSSF